MTCIFLLLEQLKEYTSLLEAQLENHLATSDSEHQNYTKEVEHVSVSSLLKQVEHEGENLEHYTKARGLGRVRCLSFSKGTLG